MSDSSQFRDEHERQLDAIIARYYRAVEVGHPPDQDLFVSQHPEFERDLREFFADLGHLQEAVPRAEANPALSDTVAMKAPQSTTIGRTSVVRYFGEYEILEELGIGGMGVVYKARQTKLRRIVALKMIKAGELANPQDVQRFQAEAKAVAKLSHPGIVAVHEVGIHQGQYFYTMNFVGGGNLSKLHHDGPVPARRAAELVRQLAEAVHYAHGQGIVHRDLKPANVLLTENGEPRITDFGLAKRMWVGEDSLEVPLTETGQILGTAGYMSPEQAAGKTRLVGPPADIYALGSVLYALLTSRAPFVGESLADTILQVIHKEPVSPHALNPSVARDLETICLKCLAKEPHKRYGTAQLLAEDLARFLDGRPVIARPISRAARTWRWCRRNPWIAGLSAAVAASLLIGTIVSSRLAMIAYQNQVESDQRGTALAKSLDDSQKLSKERTAALNDSRKKYGEIVQLTGERSTALDEARWQVYRLRLMRMEQLWREKDWGHLERLLAESVPGPGEKDLRGWEWYYLQAQLERRAWRMHERPDTQVALDWNWHTGKLAVLRTGTVEIWLPRERRLLKTITVPVTPYGYGLLRWSPDHRHLVVCIGNSLVYVIDTEMAKIVCPIVGPDPQDDCFIGHVDWSPRGDCLSVACVPRNIRLWKVAPEPVLLKSFETHEGVTPYRIHWSADQATCVTISQDGWAMYWNTADWSLLQKKRLVTQMCHDMAWSPDGTRVALGGNIVVVADADGRQSIQLANHGARISAVRWLDKERLVTVNDSHEVRIVHIDKQTPDEVFRLHSQQITTLSIGPDEQIASVAPGESVKVWSPREVAAERITLPNARLPPQAAACVWHPRSNVLGLVVQQQGSNVAATWSPGASQVEYVPPTIGVSSMHWNQSGDSLVVETTGDRWNALPWPPHEKEWPTVTTQRMGPLYSSDGRFRVEAQFHTRQIAIVDTHDKAATVHPKVDTLCAYAWHPREPWLAVAHHNVIRLCHPLLAESAWVVTPPPTNLNDHLQATRSLAWSRDGKYLLAGSSSGLVFVLDGVTLEVMQTLRGHAGSLTVVGWSNDGTRIVSAGLDNFLRWWDAAKGIELFKIPIANSDSIHELRFSADGRWLAGRSEAGKVYVWTSEGHVTPQAAPTPSLFAKLGWKVVPNSALPPRAAPTPSPFVKLNGYDKVARPLAALNEAIAASPQAANAYYDRALWYVARQQWREALRDLEQYLKLRPDDSYWRGHALSMCLLLADEDGRRRHYEMLIEKLPITTTANGPEFILRSLSLDPHASAESVTLMKALTELQQKNHLLQRFRAGVLYRAGKYPEAIAAAEEFLKNEPIKAINAEPWLFRIMALAQLKPTAQAESDLKNLKTLIERQTPEVTGDVHGFVTDAMRVRVLYREAAQLILNKSDDLKIAELTIQEASEETLESLTTHINADPSNAHSWLLRAKLHHRWHRWDQAADDYQQVVRLTPNAVWWRHDLAITSLAAGREKDYFHQCRDIEKRVSELAALSNFHTRAARILSLRPGGFADGEKLLAAAAKMAENSTESWLIHPQVPLMYRLGYYDEALREARRIEPSRLDGYWLAPLHAWEAMILWRLDRRQEAREVLALAKRHIETTRGSCGYAWGEGDVVIEAEIALREAEALVTAEN